MFRRREPSSSTFTDLPPFSLGWRKYLKKRRCVQELRRKLFSLLTNQNKKGGDFNHLSAADSVSPEAPNGQKDLTRRLLKWPDRSKWQYYQYKRSFQCVNYAWLSVFRLLRAALTRRRGPQLDPRPGEGRVPLPRTRRRTSGCWRSTDPPWGERARA